MLALSGVEFNERDFVKGLDSANCSLDTDWARK